MSPQGYAHRTVTRALSHLYSSTRLTLMQAMITVQLNRRDTESLSGGNGVPIVKDNPKWTNHV